MHQYEGAVAGAEELVSVEFADGEVLDYRKLSKTASLLGPLRSCERSSGSGRRRQRRRRQPATTVRPQKLRAKKQAAEAVAAAAAERESGTVCSELEEFLVKYRAPHTKGCLFSGAGGGFLMVINDAPVEGGLQIQINHDHLCKPFPSDTLDSPPQPLGP